VLPPQRFLGCSSASVCEAWSALARFMARFSFSDLPDFLVMVWRGDLSDIAGPLDWGPGWSRFIDVTPFVPDAAPSFGTRRRGRARGPALGRSTPLWGCTGGGVGSPATPG